MNTKSKVEELTAVMRMSQIHIAEMSNTMGAMVKLMNKLMSNQNNLNSRLLRLEKEMLELAERQDPRAHNTVVEAVSRGGSDDVNAL